MIRSEKTINHPKVINMKKNLTLLFAIAAYAIVTTSCSQPKSQAPTNADVVKSTIERALSENCTIHVPSIVIMKSTRNNDDGSWSYTVRYACMNKSGPVGSNRNDERMVLVQLRRSFDSTGNPVWATN
jgi:hypothetical protein